MHPITINHNKLNESAYNYLMVEEKSDFKEEKLYFL